MLKSTKKEKDPCQGQIFYVLRHRKKNCFYIQIFSPKETCWIISFSNLLFIHYLLSHEVGTSVINMIRWLSETERSSRRIWK